MDSRLFMEIGFVDTTFQAVDRSPYERWINDSVLDNSHSHLVIQRLLQVKDGEDNAVISLTSGIANTIEKLRNPFTYDGLTNGLYYYQKLLIPGIDHDNNSDIYYIDSNNISIEGEIYNISNNFDDIYEYIRRQNPNNCFYWDDYSFTIYDLVECYILTERERVNNYLKNNCNGNCSNNGNNLNTNADILLAAVMVIKNLMERGDYFEAQRILNGLNTCSSLCKKHNSSLKSCGCGGA